jgi:hypothetical protein
MAKGVAQVAMGWVAGKVTRVRGRRQVAYGLGMIAGAFGGRYDEYARREMP